jgi:hypothetical protein
MAVDEYDSADGGSVRFLELLEIFLMLRSEDLIFVSSVK